MASPSPEHVPMVEVVEEQLQTPAMANGDTADYDLQRRANNAERELSMQYAKIERERRKNRRLQCQINEYAEALARSAHDCREVMNKCQHISNANLACSQELRKAKLMVETLEAVIVLLYKARDSCANVSPHGGAAAS